MAKLTFSRTEIAKEIPLTEKTIQQIQQMGIPLEVTEQEVQIEALANRPDLYSLNGIVRAVRLYQGKQKPQKYTVQKPDKEHKIKIKSDVYEVRPYTVGALIKKIHITPELLRTLIELQEKLHLTLGRKRKKIAIGMYPSDKIAFPLTFTAQKPSDISFRPLGSDKVLSAEEILTLHPTGKAYAPLLAGKQKYPLFIDATGAILSMPPIINSAETGEVTTQTKELFIECSGTHLPTLHYALAILATECSEQGATIQGITIEREGTNDITPHLEYTKHAFSLERANTLLGTSIPEKELPKLCAQMGHLYEKGYISTPPWRIDIMHEVDLIEDIAIAYGYTRLQPALPKVATIGNETSARTRERTLAHLLIGLGLQEILTYHMITEEEKKTYRLKALHLENAKTEYTYLRPNLLIPLLRIYKENKDVTYPQNVFEMGIVFDEKGNERTHLCIGYSPGTLTNVQQVIAYLTQQENITYTLNEQSVPLCIPGRSATILIDKHVRGYIGEIHPRTLKTAGLKMPLAVVELDITDWLTQKK